MYGKKRKKDIKYKSLIYPKDKNCKVKEGKSKKGSGEKRYRLRDHEDENTGNRD